METQPRPRAANTPEYAPRETFATLLLQQHPVVSVQLRKSITGMPRESDRNATGMSSEYHGMYPRSASDVHPNLAMTREPPKNTTDRNTSPLRGETYNNAPCPGLTARNPCAFKTTTRNSGGRLFGVTLNRA